jgi:hypothetical protein
LVFCIVYSLLKWPYLFLVSYDSYSISAVHKSLNFVLESE